MKPQSVVIEQEELVVSLPVQPTMTTLDSKRVNERTEKEMDSLCPMPTVPIAPRPFLFAPVENPC